MARVNPIVQSMLPSQERTRQAFPAPGQFAPNDWGWSAGRAYKLDWQPGVDVCNDYNFYTRDESHQLVKNGMYGPLSNPRLVNGEVNYTINPLAQEQTNGAVNEIYKSTRVQGNMSPEGVSRYPTYQYPNKAWYTVYMGSR